MNHIPEEWKPYLEKDNGDVHVYYFPVSADINYEEGLKIIGSKYFYVIIPDMDLQFRRSGTAIRINFVCDPHLGDSFICRGITGPSPFRRKR